MNRHRDIEPVLEAWFLTGPTQMPDRLLEAVLDRVDRVPQGRFGRLRLRLTFADARRRWLALAAAAAVVATVGLATFDPGLLGRVGSWLGPSPSPSPDQSAQPLSMALRYDWVGEARDLGGGAPAAGRSILKLTASTLEFIVADGPPLVFSNAAQISANGLSLTIAAPGDGCAWRDVGTYTFTLSPSGRGMTLKAVADACSTRSAAISGDWVRTDCPVQPGLCLGDLDAGKHVSAIFTPLAAPFTMPPQSPPAYARFAYSVPGAWANPEDSPETYVLQPLDAPENARISLSTDVVPHSQSEPCAEAFEPGVGRTPSAIADWLATLPGLVVTAPAPITVGGLSGVMLDLSVAPGWTLTCQSSQGGPHISTFTDSNPGTGSDFPWAGPDWTVAGEEKARYILLDIGDGRALLIDVDAPDEATWDSLILEAMSVIETFEFKH
jgi:hypothetical protein